MGDTSDIDKLLAEHYGPNSLSTSDALDRLPSTNPLDDARGYLAQYMRRPGNPSPPTQEQWNALAYEPPRSEPSGMQKTLANILSNPDLQPAFMAANFIGPGPKFMPPRIPNPIRAYHGSPHDFDAFSLSKIGTGEGAQAYGHGLYFAEHEPVARSYRDALSMRQMSDGAAVDWNNPGAVAAAWLRTFGDKDKVLAHLRRIKPEHGADNYRVSQEAAALLERGDPLPGFAPGKMYEVALHATPEQFLDLDKRLLDPQTEKVLGGRKPGDDRHWQYSFGDVIHKPEGTARLSESGVHGVRYLDQGSRGAGSGTHNYAVWTPEIIEILKKYGIAAPVAGGALANALGGASDRQ